MSQQTRAEAIEKIAELITDIEIAMLTTIDDQGMLRSRPMATQKFAFDGDLWFYTAAEAPKVEEIEKRHQVNVSYARPDKQRYVSVSGEAELVRDRAKIEELWHADLKAWFPQGLDDPNLALLRVAVDHAEYWDSRSSTLTQFVGLASAVIKGRRAEIGEQGSIDLERGGRSGGDW